jgi:hypothetical protein
MEASMLKYVAFALLLVLPWAIGPARAQNAQIVPEDATAPMIGADLNKVQRTRDFFIFFHLVPTGPANAQGVTTFRPSGERFHDLVWLSVTTDRDARITAMTLMIRRSFIDDPKNGIFARDIVKSFIRDAPPKADANQLEALAHDIQPGGNNPSSSPDYPVFTGAQQGPVEHHLTDTDFRMAPSSDSGYPALGLSFVRH